MKTLIYLTLAVMALAVTLCFAALPPTVDVTAYQFRDQATGRTLTLKAHDNGDGTAMLYVLAVIVTPTPSSTSTATATATATFTPTPTPTP
jgi:hypothetical protein